MDADATTRKHMNDWQRGAVVHAGEEVDDIDERLAATHRWVFEAPANRARDPEARTWGILGKLTEEVGEVMSAYVGATGQNPRKGVCDTIDHVAEELLDVALTALVAYTHVRPGESPVRAFAAHLEGRMARGGLDLT